jgi:integrase-like protein
MLRIRGTLSRIDGQLVVTEPKTAKSKRVVPISDPAARLLRTVQAAQADERRLAGSTWQHTGFVFTTELGEPCDPGNAFRALRAAATKAGLPHAGLHTLRHSAASVMLTRSPATSTATSPPTSRARPSRCSATPSTSSGDGETAPQGSGRRRNVAECDGRRRRPSVVTAGHGNHEAASEAGEGPLMVVKKVVKAPEKAVRGRIRSLRIRPLSCAFALSG